MKIISKLMLCIEQEQEKDGFSQYDLSDRRLIQEICLAKKLIPSKNFFDKLKTEINSDDISALLDICGSESKAFYLKTFELCIEFKDDFKAFSTQFKNIAKPHAQKIIDSLALIILIRKINQLKLSNSICELSFAQIKLWIARKLLNNNDLSNKLYLMTTSTFIALITAGGFFFSGGFKSLGLSSIIALTCFAVSTILFYITKDDNDFENIDISGRNQIALKYRAIFYNLLPGIENKNNISTQIKSSFTYTQENSEQTIEAL